MSDDNQDALEKGPDYYRRGGIQPIEYIQANDLDFIQGCIVKYATRYEHKGQRASDLRKIIHYAELALQQGDSDDR